MRKPDPVPYDEDAGRLRALAESARLDQEHSRFPRCTLCGQPANALDKFGLCSKESKSHEEVRHR